MQTVSTKSFNTSHVLIKRRYNAFHSASISCFNTSHVLIKRNMMPWQWRIWIVSMFLLNSAIDLINGAIGRFNTLLASGDFRHSESD